MTPGPSDVAALRETGVEWVIWDAVAAGEPVVRGLSDGRAGERHGRAAVVA